jgi:hypothetical protein
MGFSADLPHRKDLLLEAHPTLDGSGNFSTDWIDSAYVDSVRVACTFNGGSPVVQVIEGQYDPDSSGDPRMMRTQTITVSANKAYAELPLTCRFFQFAVTGGLAENPVAVTVRGV